MSAHATLDPDRIHSVADSLYEIVAGKRVESTPLGAYAGGVASALVTFLNQFAFAHKLGVAFSEVLFDLGVNERRPDVSFVAWDRWTTDPPDHLVDPRSWKVIPNLAVEVVSPSNTSDEIEEKRIEYFDAGVDRVWIIFPRPQLVHVYDSASHAVVFGMYDEIEVGDFLPGLRFRVSDLFSALKKPV